MQRKNTNPFAHKAKQAAKNKNTGKRIGKSKLEKSNNQRNRILTEARGSYTIRDGRFIRE